MQLEVYLRPKESPSIVLKDEDIRIFYDGQWIAFYDGQIRVRKMKDDKKLDKSDIPVAC